MARGSRAAGSRVCRGSWDECPEASRSPPAARGPLHERPLKSHGAGRAPSEWAFVLRRESGDPVYTEAIRSASRVTVKVAGAVSGCRAWQGSDAKEMLSFFP